MARTERINLLVSPAEKADIELRARRANLSTSELVRQALARHDANVEFEVLVEIVEELGSAVARMSARLDTALERVAQLEQRGMDRAALVSEARRELQASGQRWPFQGNAQPARPDAARS